MVGTSDKVFVGMFLLKSRETQGVPVQELQETGTHVVKQMRNAK